ncbi:SigE family RNA polymerase sigma factor [Streptomyces fenghuangensis]|uniref:SigE family RNA polymerase sigma factor n=1 Tax=Streptomyces sp. ICN903 TaxID=2964654 RepID=UPI001EDBA357|nr:SigE family RNA polymerase sigma factor [Streptomyces sp. ICN903]MCG3040135.1 SigE family RNA polymerase sigma factor [Streptomyces sp. ICN903]
MDAPTEDFHAFFDRHYADLSRFAYLLLGGSEGADDLAADALVAVWRRWDSVRAGGHPLAYARSVVAGMARTRQRSLLRERRRIALFWSHRPDRIDDPDVPAVLDVRDALARLPLRKRACVVLRHAFDLSEKETARTLGISVGTVKSQTSRGIAELERMLAPARTAPGRAHGTVRALRAGAVPAEGGLPPSSPKNLTIRFR